MLPVLPIVPFVSSVMAVLKDVALRKVGGVWTLFWKKREYMRLLDATTREDAEQQIAEMLAARSGSDRLADLATTTANTEHHTGLEISST